MTGLLPVDEALRRIIASAQTAEVETVPLATAGGRVLAADLLAKRQQPPFAASAMDGYAVRAADVVNVPVSLRLVGQSAAGHAFSGVLNAGEAVRIFTGAPVPEGADSVVVQENTVAGDGEVSIAQTIAFGRNIRKAGLDFDEGDLLLRAKRVLDPAALALAAAADHPTIDVVRKPRVAILATGDELVMPGEKYRPDQIISSNSFGLAQIIRQAGGHPIDIGIAEDRLDALSDALDRALNANADILVTLGGASVGDHDLVKPALAAKGMELDFWKIALRPGKPLMFGRLQDMKILGLPGNPVSSLICAHIFLMPLIHAMLGLPHVQDLRPALLATDMGANDQRQDYVRARITKAPGGHLVATPFPVQDSSMLKFLAEANGLIVREPHAAAATAGSTCDVMMLR
ncbi:gephyrin-like molybdotransferase Glp [Phyllobacterium endophyticum]|uniref:Molybdopterin molybdenumtransferase n=1 Tax=Phyllobacterium endophyticum TaxID=1149773 RepID=A0A2P7AVB7_9HYPH|nr:gephyrin-like molybdotransferase Glp [Phyllobacterium endophyticum]MBB3234706.1 molybdopterin molybdotransferase [Phyllobacterium endophyticum]PSH58160.1 molybdopterin molybdenumtransferase MoeA [Phyllobacterium endophyticum]TYR38835.1 molybdopterin molybdotransferase MoeA [Phyllobacterium endophyticum]